jgi:hypothetical protein
MIGQSPSGLRIPAWWGPDVGGRRTSWPEGEISITVPGRVLERVGLIDPPVNPDQVLLYVLRAC